RPTITSAPASAVYGQSVTVQTPDAANIASVALLGLSSATHTQDFDTGYVPLSFTAGSGSLSVQMPPGAGYAPPGQYRLTIVNNNGAVSVGQIIQITGVPGKPAGLSAVPAGDGAATVFWTPPGQGGSPITQYTITPYVGGVAQAPTAASATATSATLTGLTDGTTYTFTVTAVNANGPGPESTASPPVTPAASPTPPGAPTSVTATLGPIGPVVSWAVPPSPGAVITSYTITPYRGGVAQTPVTVDGSAPPTAVLSGICDGALYTFTVNATNNAGTGPSSTASSALAATSACTLFGASVPTVTDSGDVAAVELGVKFTPSVAGVVTGIRFYKTGANTGTHTGTLWSSSGTILATATFTNESDFGWQTVTFSSPVALTAGTTYVASYHTDQGDYSATVGAFTSAYTNGPLQVPAGGTSGGNGVFIYGTSAFPTQSNTANNYWVDVIFQPS
ncbi:MAG TPA: DUF4082 domain-containing protein, partial [Acidimicrobiia bacterium]|nr:DUF4082 domain-containing protein [Acidimicrobiia bacterium]